MISRLFFCHSLTNICKTEWNKLSEADVFYHRIYVTYVSSFRMWNTDNKWYKTLKWICIYSFKVSWYSWSTSKHRLTKKWGNECVMTKTILFIEMTEVWYIRLEPFACLLTSWSRIMTEIYFSLISLRS